MVPRTSLPGYTFQHSWSPSRLLTLPLVGWFREPAFPVRCHGRALQEASSGSQLFAFFVCCPVTLARAPSPTLAEALWL
eukprot:437312-Karenia_brevis.AAC.1